MSLGLIGILGLNIYPVLTKRWNPQAMLNIAFHGWTDLSMTYIHAWKSFQEKAIAIKKLDENNNKLITENTILKHKLETLEFQHSTKKAQIRTQNKEKQLLKETGAETGRSMTSLKYTPPPQLSAAQLYTLGVSYFKAHEDEKAAVIFSSLINSSNSFEYHSAFHFLATGVAWYRLENYFLADLYFTEVLRKPEKEEFLPYQAKARTWKALVAKKLGKKVKTQYWLKELMDHHPKAPETALIHSNRANP